LPPNLVSTSWEDKLEFWI